MRIEDVVKALKERQASMEKAVFGTVKFDEADFAKQQGRHLGLGEAIMVISDLMRKESNED